MRRGSVARPDPRAILGVPAEHRGAVALWLLILASVVLLPDGFVRWFLPKDAVAAVAIVLASVSAARGRLPRWFAIGSAGAAGLALVAVLMSAAPAAQFWGRWPRYEGLVTLPVYLGAVWAGARLLGPAAPAARIRTLVRAASTASILLGAVSVLEALGARPVPSDLARPGSLTGNATDQGLLGALFLAVVLLPTVRAWAGAGDTPGTAELVRSARPVLPVRSVSFLDRAWPTVGLLFAAASVVLSASRAGLLAALVTVLGLAVLEGVRVAGRGRGGIRRVLLGAGGSLVLLAGAALAVPFTRDRILGASPLSAQSLEGRFEFWRQSLAVLAAHPFGVGASGFLNANAASSTAGSTLDSPHNWLLQVALAGGVPLLLVVLGIVVGAAVVGVRAWLRAAHSATDAARRDLLAGALAALAGCGVGLLTAFTAPSTTIFAAVLVGVVVARGTGAGTEVRAGIGVQGVRDVRPGGVAGGKRVGAGIRSVLLLGWAVWLIVVAGEEIPLAAGVAAAGRGDVVAAEGAFAQAQALRPWDADLAGIAAQSFAAAADTAAAQSARAQASGAAADAVNRAGAAKATAGARAVEWAQRSRLALPGTVSTERALAVGQLDTGDLAGARDTLGRLAVLTPLNADVAVQNAVVLYLSGDTVGCAAEVQRALALDPHQPTALQLRSVLAGR